ncbi:PepSY-associated TM helix domain-containing protein [Marinobacterium mangrovicola]|uniref:Putative iron-regulated membrane protein n=1 Tax=Marinobacterium mangrovicola TaxID=1476959 RepID=A0A4R1GAX3_9GAMM|nr:PepSY-associated TM helix domain-containing protein [Marinobacterium mangrovicola]TCK03675.1 putative iron-regulated membrane protein [Marinobacterium mangrovicola]
MKESFRQSMAWLHTWTGLIAGWILFFVFVTGTSGYFDDEITRWMEPERPLPLQQSLSGDREQLINTALDRLQKVAPEAQNWVVTLPHASLTPRGWHDFTLGWQDLPKRGQAFGLRGRETLSTETAAPLPPVEVRQTGGGMQLYRMHYALSYMPYPVGIRLVGLCTLLMLLALITGVVIHKKIFKDFFTFRPNKNRRSWLDAHNLCGVMALPFFLMITYSGLVFFAAQYMPAGIATLYGTDRPAARAFFDELTEREGDVYLAVTRPAANIETLLSTAEERWGEGQVASIRVEHLQGQPQHVDIERVAGDKVRYERQILRFDAADGTPLPSDPPLNATILTNETLRALHEGIFAGPWLRWLYFFSGLLGCAMIGTGMVLWSVKRRKRNHSDSNLGHRLVEALNLATIVGLPAGVAGYFWANRLLPLDMADRSAWEVHCLFLIFGEALLYGLLRDTRRAWVELLFFASAAFTLLPLLNLLTTDIHLGNTLARGDWALAGVDLTFLGLGALFAYMGIKVRRRWLPSPQKATAVEQQPRVAAAAREAH